MKYQITETDLLHIANLELLARTVVEGFLTGLHKSPYHGFSVEFAEHRQYNTGESTRHIDWKLFGRTDKLFVKRYEEETNLRCQLVIDTSPSMYYPPEHISKIRFSAIAAASLIYLMRKQRDASGLSLFNDKLWYHSGARLTLSHQKLLYAKLQECLNLQPSGNTSAVAETLHHLAEGLHRRSLVIVFSDFFQNNSPEMFSALQHLVYNKHEVILFDVHDEVHEVQFDFDNRPYLFTDMESGGEVKLHPRSFREQYHAAYLASREELHMKCMQYKIDYNAIHLGMDFNQVLMPFIKKKKSSKGQ